jgi:hypothetical protein
MLTYDNSTGAQRQRILDHLRICPLTTLDARYTLDVLHPAARVMELRQAGFKIVTVRVVADNGSGRPHSVAKYVLQPSAESKQHEA